MIVRPAAPMSAQHPDVVPPLCDNVRNVLKMMNRHEEGQKPNRLNAI